MKSVLDNLRPEPRPNMWQNCERLSWKTDDEQFTMFATLSACCMERASEFCWMSSTCGILQQNLSQGWQRCSWHVARCAAVFGFYKYNIHPPPSLLTGPHPLWFFSYSPRWNCSSRGDILMALKRSRPYRRTSWRRWHKMTYRHASDHGNPAGIDVSMPNGTILKGMGANRNFGKWQSYGRGILGTFG